MKKIFLLFATAFAVASCSDSNDKAAATPDSLNQITFTSTINATTTKATDMAFEQGDAISVYAKDESGASYESNVKYTYAGTTFESSTPIEFEDDYSKLSFTALYPYSSKESTQFVIDDDQTTYADYIKNDLLSASVAATSERVVDLTFSHRMAKVEVELVSDDVDLTDAEVVVYSQLSVDYDLETSTFVASGDRYPISCGSDGIANFYAIIAPQSYEAGSVFMEIHVNRMVYSWTFDSAVTIDSGYKYVCIADIESADVTFEGDISSWNDGGDIDLSYGGTSTDDQIVMELVSVSSTDVIVDIEKKYFDGNFYVGLVATADFDGDAQTLASELISAEIEGGVDLSQVDDMRLFSDGGEISLSAGWSLASGVEYMIVSFGVDGSGKVLTNVAELVASTSVDSFIPDVEFGTITVSNITSSSYTFTCSPLDQELRYIIRYYDRATFDSFESLDDVVAADVEYYQSVADAYGYPLSTLLPMFMFLGENAINVTWLESATDYVCYAYVFDYVNCVPLSKIEVEYITTL